MPRGRHGVFYFEATYANPVNCLHEILSLYLYRADSARLSGAG